MQEIAVVQPIRAAMRARRQAPDLMIAAFIGSGVEQVWGELVKEDDIGLLSQDDMTRAILTYLPMLQVKIEPLRRCVMGSVYYDVVVTFAVVMARSIAMRRELNPEDIADDLVRQMLSVWDTGGEIEEPLAGNLPAVLTA